MLSWFESMLQSSTKAHGAEIGDPLPSLLSGNCSPHSDFHRGYGIQGL
jgi:hypothetical protein